MKIRDGMFTVASGSQGHVAYHIATADSLFGAFTSIIFFLSLSVACGFWSAVSFAEPVSSTDLIENAKEYNNKVVEYEGEVVGDVMGRGDFAWVNLNDGKNAIGVWGSKAIMDKLVNCKGYYNCKGDILRVKGVFHRACPEHGGDLDIHIVEAMRMAKGGNIFYPINMSKVANAFGLSIVALGLAILYAFKVLKGPWKKR